ncbi:Type i inositol 3, partial [Globisporangium splendens]
MSFENLYGIEVYRLALRETLNEGGGEHGSSAETAESSGDVGAEKNTSEGANMGQADDIKKNASASGGEEAREVGDVVKLDPIPPRRGSKDASGSSQRVLLVTRPSQRDMQIWAQRATSKMVRSAGGTMRSQVTSAQSKRWVLEYKPVVRHSGWLIKRGNGRLRSFKRRLFCIIDNELVYHDSHSAVEVRGRVDLSKKSTVQPLLHSGFKLAQGSLQMALYAVDKHERDVWIKKLQEHNVELLPASSKTVKQLEKQSSLPDENRILFSGWLRKRGQMVKSTKRRWFELSMTTLTYYTHPQGTKKGSLEITDAKISHMDTLKSGERHSFQVKTPSRRLILHADSQEDRSLWVASLSSAAEGSSSVTDSFSIASMTSEVDRCTCGGANESDVGDGNPSQCLRCKSSFIAPSEGALTDVTREVQLILASPYSPEGSTSGAFIKENTGKPVSNFVVREFMSGLADYMIHTRMNELRSLGGHTDASSSDDDDEITEPPFTEDSVEFIERILVAIYEQIEERVFFPLYKGIHDNITQQTRADSKLIQGKMDILRSKSQSFFGIGPDSISPSDWSSACAKLKEIDKVSLPHMKRAQLLAACKEIYTVYHQEHPKSAPMSADDFIPAFIYVLIQSNLDNPVALKEMITVFDTGSTQGEIAYFVTCLEIGLEYIRSLLTACTVILDATKQLGIEFAKDPERDVAVVYHLVPGGQAEKSKAVTVGDVVVAVNGLPVYEMALDEIVKIIRGVDGDAELCFLPMDEYEMKFGMSRKSADDPRDTTSTQSGALA